MNGILVGTGTGGSMSSNSVCQGLLSSDYILSPNTNVTIPFVVDFDPQNWLISNQFRPIVAGYYSITVNVWWKASTTTGSQKKYKNH